MDTPKASPYRGSQTTMMVISIVFTILGAVAVILRLVGRWIIVRKFGVDDITMFVGMVLTGGYLFEILYGLHFGLGLHGADIAFEEMPNVLKMIYSIQLTYNTIIALVKISIVCFYLRLATVDSALRKGSWATILFLITFYITTQITTTLQCLPIAGNWDLSGNVKKKCINTVVYFYVVAVVNILIDIWILLLPIRTLSNIKRSRRDKVVLFIIFGVGGFSCISSIIRLYTIKVFATSKDPFFDGVPINIWSMIEINVAVVCASVPAMKPLFTKAVRERMTSSKSTRTAFNSYGHQMLPLSGEENKSPSGVFREGKSGYIAKATSKGMGDSEEHINSKIQGIEYEREFTIEESYIGSGSKSTSGSSRV
ncbi:hypothetical protein IFR04_014147 [Cadophora malorum]|uniref:Rhodopsin domain-containing protein n=1 Tax=Cadophora malorum TaxID=108018 RepID=A0A8H7T5N8_9HELO|nr:hypothetical protein IFR04_014147 [Cadophora malorum]